MKFTTTFGCHVSVFGLLFLASPSVKADGDWRARAAIVSIDSNGESELTRPNGKVVTTDISAEVGVDLSVEYQFNNRLGFTLGYLGGSEHEINLHQDFPDGTDFMTSDSFRFNALTVGLAIDLMSRREIEFYLEPFLAYVAFDDVLLESAGAPFDRDTPLDFQIDDKLGFGAAMGLDLPIGQGNWVFHARARVLVVEFEGETSPDPVDPSFSSSIGLDFNALILGIGAGYRF